MNANGSRGVLHSCECHRLPDPYRSCGYWQGAADFVTPRLMSLFKVIGVGELLCDLFPERRNPGGAPANFAFHAAQFGCLGMVASAVGQDELGRELVDFLDQQGVKTELIQSNANPTGQVTVDLSRPDHPQYTIHPGAAWDHLAETATWLAAAKLADVICFGTLGQRATESRLVIQSLLKATSGMKVFDVNFRQQWYNRDVVAEGLALADLVKLNEDEANQLGPLLGYGPLDRLSLRDRLASDFGVETLCITRAERGCWVWSADEGAFDIAGEPVTVVDPVGAGDAFTAALVTSLFTHPLKESAQIANRVGAYVATQPGAMARVPESVLS